MADRSVVVRLTAQVDGYKRQMDSAAKSTADLEQRAGRAGRAVDDQAKAARRSADATDKAGREAAEAGGQFDKAGKGAAAAATGMEKASAKSASAAGTLKGLAQSARDNQAEWRTLGTTFAAGGVAIAGGLGLATREAIKWESAFAGVKKTTEGSDAEYAALEQSLRDLAKTLPATHEEIAGVAEAAGQLGVGRDDIAAFTKTAIDMGESTNLSAEEAATGLAQLGNVMGVLPDEADRAGAALVDLGNNGASTEADILAMSLRLAGAGKTIGATEADVLGLASGLANVGIEAEAGGSALSRVMVDIAQSVETGNSKLGTFAEVAGLSTEEFSAAFRDDAAGAVVTFVEGLGRMQASGESVFGTLDELELSEIRVRDALLRTAGAGDMLRQSLDLGSDAWAANTALVDEANARYETSAARIETARNQLSDAAIDLGATFVPLLADGAEALAGLVSTFSELPGPVQEGVGVLGGLTAAAGLAAGAFLLVVPRVVETVDAMSKLRETSPGAAGGLGKVARAATGALTVYATARGIMELAEAVGDAGQVMRENALDEAIQRVAEGDLSAVDAQFQNFGDSLVRAAPEVDGMTGALDRLFAPQMWQRSLDFFQAAEQQMFGTRSEVGQLEDRFAGLDAQLSAMVQGGQGAAAGEFFGQITSYADEQGYSLEKLNSYFPAYQDALVGVQQSQQAAAESGQGAAGAIASIAGAAATVAPTLAESFGSWESWIAYHQLSEDAVEALRDRTNEFAETLVGFVDPFGTYSDLLTAKQDQEKVTAEATAAATDDQEDSWEDYVTNASLSLNEWITALEEQQIAQQEWSDNLVRLSARASDDVVQMFIDAGPESATALRDLVNGSENELARLEPIARQNAEDAAFGMADEINRKKALVSRIAGEFGEDAASAAAEKLANGTATISDIAADYGYALAQGVNPVLEAVGKKIDMTSMGRRDAARARRNADGSVTDYYASGGLREDHVAQIAPAGAWRVWAEEETGGEAYIPLAVSKRKRSLEIYRETGRRLGVDPHEGHDHGDDHPDHSYEAYVDGGLRSAQRYADGGFTSTAKVPKVPSTNSAPPVSTAYQSAAGKAREDVIDWLEENLALAYPPATAAGNPYVGGGGNSTIVQIGRFLQSRGARISGHSAWGRIGRHSPTSLHYKNRAIDVNYGGGGANAAENRFVRGILPTLYKMANFKQVYYREIGGRTDHDDHLHLGIANGAVLDQTKGSALNPHVRDQGGPLLPGFTYNGTGGNEMVVPTHVTDALQSAAARPSVVAGRMELVGTLDLGNGLTGLVRGIATDVTSRGIAAYDRAETLAASYNPEVV